MAILREIVFAQVRLEFLRGFFEHNCVENNKGRPILTAAKMFSITQFSGDIRFMRIFAVVLKIYVNFL